jgi:3D-(3,5/4)-trihydroxycyclohexane-1,2-dione acylhydrolase (decyclizing)
VCETQAGKSALPWNHPLALGPIGATGGQAANQFAREADLVIAIGSRLGDFTTMSKTAFANPDVRFVAMNVCEMDAMKLAAIPVIADARVALQELQARVAGFSTSGDYRALVASRVPAWTAEVDHQMAPRNAVPFAQAEVVGAVNQSARPKDVVVCAAGSLPGDLHKLWRSQQPNTYHVEYGYSCMGYEIAGGLGVKMADPSREVYVMVGDGSYLMMAQEIVTSVQEGFKLIIVLCDSEGYASIGALSRSVGSGGFGTQYRYRDQATGTLIGPSLPVDLSANAASLGAIVHRVSNRASLDASLAAARGSERTTVIYVPVDPNLGVPGYDSWWDVAVAEVSEQAPVRKARAEWEAGRKRQRPFL